MNITSLKTKFPKVYKLIAQTDVKALPNGRHDLNDGAYVNVESYVTQKRTERRFEAHVKFVDVQMILSGTEIIIVRPVEELKNSVSTPYCAEKDIEFYTAPTGGKEHLLKENDALVLFPNEAHMPCVAVEAPQLVRKAVFKLPIELFA
ncbi:MAG: YhcH/YjgK/YiaL family protein [Candidatus Riflebacteria bacterium]|nr:YhcH/YjgK/YiaL family protein [Candidatus Riflebacteria bacterium]